MSIFLSLPNKLFLAARLGHELRDLTYYMNYFYTQVRYDHKLQDKSVGELNNIFSRWFVLSAQTDVSIKNVIADPRSRLRIQNKMPEARYLRSNLFKERSVHHPL